MDEREPPDEQQRDAVKRFGVHTWTCGCGARGGPFVSADIADADLAQHNAATHQSVASLKASLSKAIEERDAARGEVKRLKERETNLSEAYASADGDRKHLYAELAGLRKLLQESEAKCAQLTKEKVERGQSENFREGAAMWRARFQDLEVEHEQVLKLLAKAILKSEGK